MSYKNLNMLSNHVDSRKLYLWKYKLENKMLKFQRQMKIFISDVENLLKKQQKKNQNL